MEQFQLMIIGGGPGGYVSAIRAAQLGLKVALVENRNIGGTCLNRGCMPTKALLHATSLYAECSHFDSLGLSMEGLSYDITKIHGRKNQVVETLRSGVEQLLKANKIDLIPGTGVILKPGLVSVEGTEYQTDKILIATGSVPSRPPIPGLESEGVVTSDDILEGNPRDYKSLLIIGGGVIGVEMASVYSNLGCQVTIVEAMERILPTMDKEISQNLSIILKKRGVQIYSSARVEKISKEQAGLICHFSSKGIAASVQAEGVLVSIGRQPNTNGLFGPGFEVEMDRGFIVTDDKFATSAEGIYAVGDVIGGIQLAHKAEAEGLAAVEMICGHKPATDPHVVPSCIYTNPEIASVGLTASEAQANKLEVKSAKYVMSGNGKSIIDMQERGFIKLLFDAQSDALLGVQMMCARATDMISEFTGMIVNGITHEQLLRGMRPHPSFSEGITEALDAVYGQSIHSAPVRK